jgi:hypothetical protein
MSPLLIIVHSRPLCLQPSSIVLSADVSSSVQGLLPLLGLDRLGLHSRDRPLPFAFAWSRPVRIRADSLNTCTWRGRLHLRAKALGLVSCIQALKTTQYHSRALRGNISALIYPLPWHGGDPPLGCGLPEFLHQAIPAIFIYSRNS